MKIQAQQHQPQVGTGTHWNREGLGDTGVGAEGGPEPRITQAASG